MKTSTFSVVLDSNQVTVHLCSDVYMWDHKKETNYIICVYIYVIKGPFCSSELVSVLLLFHIAASESCPHHLCFCDFPTDFKLVQRANMSSPDQCETEPVFMSDCGDQSVFTR